MQDEYAAAAPVHKKRPKPVEGEAPAAAGEAPEAKRPKADAAGDAAGEKPPRKKPGPKPGFKRKPKVDGGAPAVQGDAAGSESAPASQADAPASPPRHKPAVAHAEATATPEAPAGKGAAKVPLQLRVIVEALNVRFLVRVSKSLTVHTVRNRIEAQYARLYPEIASHDGGALEVHKLLDSERFELDDRDPIGAVVPDGGVVYVQTLASYQAQVAARLKALPAGGSSAGKAATPKKPKAAPAAAPAPAPKAPAPPAARPAAAAGDEDDDEDDDDEAAAAAPVLKTGGASKVASVPPPKPARKGDVASFESPTGSPATKAGARPTVAAKAAPSAAKRLPVTAAAAAAEEEDDEADEDEDEDEDDVAARAPKVPVSTVIPSTKAFGAGAKGFPTASAKPAAAPAAPAAESDEDDDDDDDDDLPPPSKAAKPAKTGAGLQALARDGAKVNAAAAPAKAGTAVVAVPGKTASAKAGKTPAEAPAKAAAAKPAKPAPAAASDDDDDDDDSD